MTLTQNRHFCVCKSLQSNYWISHITQLLLICKFCCFSKGPQISINMRDMIIYVAQWWEKYLSKRSLLKHTFSWRDKLIVLWSSYSSTDIFLSAISVSDWLINILLWKFRTSSGKEMKTETKMIKPQFLMKSNNNKNKSQKIIFKNKVAFFTLNSPH